MGVSSVLELVFKKLEFMIYSKSCFSMYSQYQCDANAVIGERVKRARHYQGRTNLSWCGICIR